MIRIMLEDIALSPLSATQAVARRFTLLSALDQLPVTARAEWGHLLLDMLDDVPNVASDSCKWRFRRLLKEDGTGQLIVGAATRFDDVIQANFTAYVRLRHHEVTSRTGYSEKSFTLGVLLTPRHDGRRPWDTSTTLVHGDPGLSDEELRVYSALWNQSNGTDESTQST